MNELSSAEPPGEQKGRARPFLWASSTYFAEGLPWSVLHQLAAEYFTSQGLAPSLVGKTSLLHAPMLMKAFVSPLLERLLSLRSWMVGTQLAMGGAILAIAWQAERGEPSGAVLWGLLLLVGLLSALHDISCDGYYMAQLDDRDQARWSGLRVAAFRAAMLVGSSGLVYLGGTFGFGVGFGLAALLLLMLAVFHQRWLPRSLASTAISGETSSFSSYLSFVRQPSAVLILLFLVLYKVADVLMFSMSKVLLDQELGMATDVRGLLGFFSTGASILGAVVGGIWVARSGLQRALFPITLLMAVTEPLYALLATFAPALRLALPGQLATLGSLSVEQHGPALLAIGTVVVTEQICGGFATAAQVVFIMRRCDPLHRTAHYAFATVVYSLAHIVFGSSSGYLYEALGATFYYWCVSFLALPAVILARLVPTNARGASSAAATSG